jgi:hypothetical protein
MRGGQEKTIALTESLISNPLQEISIYLQANQMVLQNFK